MSIWEGIVTIIVTSLLLHAIVLIQNNHQKHNYTVTKKGQDE